ncbi:MAG TPA: hypothetical protein VFU50_00360 [Terriglobales bacterium]|nr:hypothetical protein [Terriglobales bacterium]
MITSLAELVNKHRDQGVLVDSNLLLLLFIGSYEKTLISKFKRTEKFLIEDFETLLNFLSLFQQIVTTPNVVTEVSNLANQLPEHAKTGFYNLFYSLIDRWNEQFTSTSRLLSDAQLRILGIADLSISAVAARPILVLTDDFRLAGKLQQRGLDVVNFNHLRSYLWE